MFMTVLALLVPALAAESVPDAFFDYSSSRPPTLDRIGALAACRVGGDPARHVLVGVDAGNPEDIAVVLSAKATVPGVRLHLYVEGPGGVTGDTGWSADECRRVKEAALSVQSTAEKDQFPVGDLGKNDCDGAAAWIARWRSTWWLEYTFRQIADASARGFESFEIDNLGAAQFRGAPVRGANLVAFYEHFQGWSAAQEATPDGAASGRRLSILMKNLEPDELDLVAAALRVGTLRRSGFSDFHVSERGSGNRKQQHTKSAAFGIQTIDSNDTYHYTATGPYRVVGEREGRDRGCVPVASR